MDWIFIRGLQREAGHFGDFGPAFVAALPSARVHFLDLPGNGEHHRARTPLSVAAMTARLRDDAAALGLRRPYLLGLSLGAMVACDWALRHPRELAGIVVINTSLGGHSPPWHRFRPRALPTTIAVAREQDLLRRERRLISLASARPELYASAAARWAGIARVRPVSRGNTIRQVVAAARFRPPRLRPSVPHLILAGRNDRVCDARCSEAIAAAWGSQAWVHPTAGHDLTLDAPSWLIEQISAWLAARTDA